VTSAANCSATAFIGTHIDLVEVSTERARTLRVESPDINAYADGDYVCPLPTDISAVPGELRILVPARTRP
jgi:diacylglycerol kinase (ATP)